MFVFHQNDIFITETHKYAFLAQLWKKSHRVPLYELGSKCIVRRMMLQHYAHSHCVNCSVDFCNHRNKDMCNHRKRS